MSTKTLKCWFLNTDLMEVEEGQAIQRDHDGYHVINHGYVVNEFVFTRESDAKTALISHLERKIVSLTDKLNRLRG